MDCLTRNPGVQVATFEPQVEPDPEPEVETEVEPPNVNIEAEWNEVTRQLPSENPLRFEEFALVDEGVAVTGTMTDDDILDSLTNDEDAPSDEDHEEEEPADVTSKEARATVRTPSCISNSIICSSSSVERVDGSDDYRGFLAALTEPCRVISVPRPPRKMSQRVMPSRRTVCPDLDND
ncbi:hypothetical protein WA026_008546 [Henosepilachna vigintioctopunctata]|uniref:Uncharacterized protein n=1 Tax=Henosepilachna vigintioctopunctata TaxID=420089 RepID=A0AAW1UH23_9CUCU